VSDSKEKKETRKKERVPTPSRRDFLKGMAIGAGGLAMGSLLARQAEAIDIETFTLKPSTRGEKIAGGRIVHDYRACSGCQVCELTCAMYNHKEVNPSKSRIKIYTHQPTVFIGIVCQQCMDRPCINACPVEPDEEGRRALYENPNTKALAVNLDTCINCGACVDACKSQRNGNIYMNASDIPDGYCTLCDGVPQCVEMCPWNALMVVPRTTDGMYAAKPADVLAKWAIDTLYGGPRMIIDNWK
jgi:Fe-S-cluster-containing hydrogenase component 2